MDYRIFNMTTWSSNAWVHTTLVYFYLFCKTGCLFHGAGGGSGPHFSFGRALGPHFMKSFKQHCIWTVRASHVEASYMWIVPASILMAVVCLCVCRCGWFQVMHLILLGVSTAACSNNGRIEIFLLSYASFDSFHCFFFFIFSPLHPWCFLSLSTSLLRVRTSYATWSFVQTREDGARPCHVTATWAWALKCRHHPASESQACWIGSTPVLYSKNQQLLPPAPQNFKWKLIQEP